MVKTLAPRVKTLKPQLQSVSRTKRITGTTLQNIRKKYFRANPLCVECEKQGITRLAVELDHIVELADGGAESESNRQGLCKDCHTAKSAAQARLRRSG